MGRVLQSAPAVLLACGAAFVAAEAAAEPSPRLDHPAIRHSALLAVLLWALAVGLMLRSRYTERACYSIRLAWLCAWLMFVVHVAAAFHLAHGWSHAAAYQHTEEASGFGPGLYVNYLFTLIWGVDAVWLAAAPHSYAGRPRWVGWLVHGFLGFILFNAVIVFGSPLSRVLGVLVLVALRFVVYRGRKHHQKATKTNIPRGI